MAALGRAPAQEILAAQLGQRRQQPGVGEQLPAIFVDYLLARAANIDLQLVAPLARRQEEAAAL